MTKKQKMILAILSLIAIVLVGVAGRKYQLFASKPLGPALPVAQQTMPSLWTATPNKYSTAPIASPTKTPKPLCGGPSVMTILAIGQDQRSNNYQYGLSDIIRVVRVDFVTPRVTVLEFPRDLWVEIPYISDNLNGVDHGKLNQAYLYGQPGNGDSFHYWDDPSQGPGLLSLTLTLNFGVLADHYVAVNMRTFEKVVNAMEGITVNIPDEETAYHTGLTIGRHHLNGAQALKVARNRKEGMYERVKNQNLVLCAMREKALSPKIVTKIPALIKSFQDNIQTDFTPDQLSQLACLGTKLPAKNIAFASFPQELLKQDVRIFAPPAPSNGTLVTQADFNVLRTYVTLFNEGTWPSLPVSASSTLTETAPTEETSSSFCP